ncbi:hypothetical protein IGI04_025619 [Brassica rapa subsp. trilocularis]|uniref:Uncharacterized protein n=1 Tax=Brassica rapa subsp. trilocularis TaxID=1813537 RepID=A0ABQ7KTW4_BRACM|nr:hypothetical protein IGI04_025619 [Brassica rapa subsp. trilocularis]
MWCTEYSPCSDTQISKRDGFIVGVAISSREAFFLDQVQLYPCDSRLGLAAKMAQLVLFRPKVMEFQKGVLQNLFWKSFGCDSCKGTSSSVCLNRTDCAVSIAKCKARGGAANCNIRIQVAFSGTETLSH